MLTIPTSRTPTNDLWGGNIKIVEEVTDYFVVHGIQVAVQEDVNTLLVDNNIIKPLPSEQLAYGSGGDDKYKSRTKLIGTPEYDLVNIEHSEDMREEIINVIKSERALEHSEQPPFKKDVTEIEFERTEFSQAADKLGITLPKNLGDVLYSFRYRRAIASKMS